MINCLNNFISFLQCLCTPLWWTSSLLHEKNFKGPQGQTPRSKEPNMWNVSWVPAAKYLGPQSISLGAPGYLQDPVRQCSSLEFSQKFRVLNIAVNPWSTQIWRHLEIFRGTKWASKGRGIKPKLEASVVGGEGGGGGGRGFYHLVSKCPPPHSPRDFAVCFRQNFTTRNPTITQATQATTLMKKKIEKRHGCYLLGDLVV